MPWKTSLQYGEYAMIDSATGKANLQKWIGFILVSPI